MNLCIIGDGLSTHTQHWAEYFARSHEVHLITYDPMGITIDGVTEHVIGSRFRNIYLDFWPRHLEIQSLIRRIRPDLIHAHFVTKYGFHIPWNGKIPTIVHAWGDDILILPDESLLIRFFTGRVLRRASLVYAVSEDIRQRIIARFHVRPEKVRHMPFGVDTAVFSPAAGKPVRGEGEPLCILSNRKFWPVHGGTTLVDGFSTAYRRNPGMRLVLRGFGPEEENLRRRIASNHTGGAIAIRAQGPYARIVEDLRRADIYVSAARSDGTPVSLLEAMATGLPCIATRVGGIPEWIRDGENGLLVPPEDPEALAEAILRLSGDPALRDLLGRRARETILSRGSWHDLMQVVEKDYLELVQSSGKGT